MQGMRSNITSGRARRYRRQRDEALDVLRMVDRNIPEPDGFRQQVCIGFESRFLCAEDAARYAGGCPPGRANAAVALLWRQDPVEDSWRQSAIPVFDVDSNSSQPPATRDHRDSDRFTMCDRADVSVRPERSTARCPWQGNRSHADIGHGGSCRGSPEEKRFAADIRERLGHSRHITWVSVILNERMRSANAKTAVKFTCVLKPFGQQQTDFAGRHGWSSHSDRIRQWCQK